MGEEMKKFFLTVFGLASALFLIGVAGISDITEYSGVADAANQYDHSSNLPIFDTHVHYKEPAWEVYPPKEIIKLMKRSGVFRALVSSSPDEGTRMLYREDPTRIIPFLRPYHDDVTSSNWFLKSDVVSYLRERLKKPIYQGIGEFHIHDAGDADSVVIRKTVDLAVKNDLYIHIHSGAKAVETVFSYAPLAKILWAHAGMSESPSVVTDMLSRHKNLWVDISIREYEIAPNGTLDQEWKKLFLTHTDRITIGSDTWVNSQWDNYESIIAFDRNWLKQLPIDVSKRIAYKNALKLFDRRK